MEELSLTKFLIIAGIIHIITSIWEWRSVNIHKKEKKVNYKYRVQGGFFLGGIFIIYAIYLVFKN